MAEGDIGAEIGRLEFEAGTATDPKLIHVTGDIFAIAYTGPDGDGWIATVKIDSAGAIPATVEASHEFEAGAANDIDFIKVANGVFAVVYRDAVNHGWIKTVTIDTAGAIADVVGGSLNYIVAATYTPNIIKVAPNIFAIAYRDASVQGVVTTVGISDAGAIADLPADPMTFDGTRALKPRIIHVTGDIFAIAYTGVDDDGWIVAVDIDAAGTVTDPAAAAFEFEEADVSDCKILRINAGTYVLAFTNSGANGKLVTVSIDPAGVIGDPILNDRVFEAGAASAMHIIHVSGNLFAIAYRGVADDGWLKTWEISETGVIAALKQDELEFDEEYGAFPAILHVSGNIYAIAYTSGATGGAVISVDIETVTAAAAAQHILMMGIG